MSDFKIGDKVWVQGEVWGYQGGRDRLVLEVGNGEVIANKANCRSLVEGDIKRGDEMTDFQIGDVVRLKSDGPDKLKMIVRNIDLTDGQILCRSECSNRIMWASPLSLKLAHRPDPQADIKQAIREVLLSDEFMTAFAAVLMKTPLPLAMQYDSKFEIVNSAELASLPEAKPTTAQSLADRTLKAIWQANEPKNEGGKQ